MKSAKYSAALIAALTACTPLMLNSSAFLAAPTAFADSAGVPATLPDWIPTDFDSAAEYRNTYGATHIDNGLVCVVSIFKKDPVPEGEPQGVLRYDIQCTDKSVKMLRHTSFGSENSSYYYDIAVFDPQQKADFDIAVIDTWAKDTDPDLQYGHAINRYSFSAEDGMNITETDIYSWLPDSKTEFYEYQKNNGEVSVHDNYIVFCTTTIDQFGDSWEPDSTNKYENIEYLLSSDCTMQTRDLYVDGSIDVIYVCQAVQDGYEKISWTRTSSHRADPEEPLTYTLTADCVILDDAQTVLLANTARIRILNADTGELIDLPTGSDAFQFALKIGYKTEQGKYSYVDPEDLFADRNPYIWDFSEYRDADILSIDLLYSSVRKYYWFPDGYRKQVIYDNGARDITISLKPNQDGLQQDTVRFTFVDAETGAPLQITEHADAYLFEASMSYLGSGEPMRFMDEYFTINPNPYIWDITLEASAGVKLTELNSFYFYAKTLPEDCELIGENIKKTVYDYNAMDVIVPLKFTGKGDVNGDGEFSLADLVLLQKWLIADPDAQLANWKAADFSNDGKLTAADLSLMKRALLGKQTDYVRPETDIQYGNPLEVAADQLNLYLGPDPSYPVAATIPRGAMIYEQGFMEGDNLWIFTEYEGQFGWVRLYEADNRTRTVYELVAPAKPVIYLYPEQETDVHVELELTEAELNTTYPKYNDGWDVTAYPDGTLVNKADGSHHRYLFWDAVNCRTRFDFSEGFCVAGCDTEQFLKEKLTYMGLTEDEMNEFIVYWLPLMEHNAYNLIAFQGDAYTNSAKLTVTPAPDRECRVFMAYIPLENAVEIEPQELETFERTGFALVVWDPAPNPAGGMIPPDPSIWAEHIFKVSRKPFQRLARVQRRGASGRAPQSAKLLTLYFCHLLQCKFFCSKLIRYASNNRRIP